MVESKTIRVGRIHFMRHGLPVLAALLGVGAPAQTASPAVGATSPVTPVNNAVAAPSEALQRQALGPYRMILRSAAVANKPKTAPASAAAANSTTATATHRQNTAKPPVEPTPPARPDTAPQSPEVAVTPIATPPVQPVEVPAPGVGATSPAPMVVSALTSPAPAPAAVAVKSALILIKNDPPALSGPLARESPTGIVRVAFKVNPDGSTSDFKIAASSNRRLNSAVVAAVTKWRYQPIDAAQTTEVEMVFSAE